MLGALLTTGLPALRPALLSTSLLLMARTIFDDVRNDLRVIKSVRPFPHDAATDEAFERTQFTMIFGRHKADGVAHGLRPARAPNAVDIILDVHREIVVHDVRNAVYVNDARRDIRPH